MINDKLNRRESEVMNAVYELSGGKERFLVSLFELNAVLPKNAVRDEDALESTLRALEIDGYFDYVLSDRKGERTYVIHMREAGLSYRRRDYQRKRALCFRLAVAAAGAVVTFLVGLLLKALFH